MDPQKIKEIMIHDLSSQIPELVEGENDFLLNPLTSKKNIVFDTKYSIIYNDRNKKCTGGNGF